MHSLTWDDGDLPISDLFGDAFYSRHDGRAEAAYVFVDGNGLPRRWVGREGFVIGELGFGTGLNFLETWQHWIATRAPDQQLSFVSFERYMMAADDMARALSAWATLAPLSKELLERWSNARSGGGEWRWSVDPQTELVVIPGDAETSVAAWCGEADAWYLDGFAPAKNPDMWSASLMQCIFDRTVPDGTFATYTAAGWVRRNLEGAGFKVLRRSGHAGKREMMLGFKPDIG